MDMRASQPDPLAGSLLALNPALDLDACARVYHRDGLVRIPHALTPAAAAHIFQVLAGQTPWRLTIADARSMRPELFDQPALKAIDPQVISQKVKAAAERAQIGFSYVYLSYPMIDAYLAGWNPGHPINAIADFINGPQILGLFRAITGEAGVCKADAQATHYRPGDFLTLHDDGPIAGRVCAYTLGFTRPWRPDWGGQLLFHDAQGEIERGFMPGFNVMTLFKVPHMHSVAPVATYAGAPRLSIVGWARNDRKV